MPPFLLTLAWLALLPWKAPTDPFALQAAERLGPFRLGQPEAEARAALPCPASATPRELWGADGAWHFTLRAPACGVLLGLAAPTQAGAAQVQSVTVTPPSLLATARGVRVGSDEAAVRRAYRAELDAEATEPGHRLVAGSIYGGLIFTLEHGEVRAIFLGAAAE